MAHNPCGCGQRNNFYSIPLKPNQNRPHFRCGNCGKEWSAGLKGGTYADYLKTKGKPVYYPQEAE